MGINKNSNQQPYDFLGHKKRMNNDTKLFRDQSLLAEY